jgi:hypothetical protein
MVQGKIVPYKWLPAIFVDPLQHLIPCGISQSGEQRGELARGALVGELFEDDGVEL